jgi:hypothetical protein
MRHLYSRRRCLSDFQCLAACVGFFGLKQHVKTFRAWMDGRNSREMEMKIQIFSIYRRHRRHGNVDISYAMQYVLNKGKHSCIL